MQEWTTILTPGGLVVTIQRRGQNGYFALSIDGLVTMRRGSQDSTGRADWMQQLAAVERKAWKAWKAWASMAALSIISLSSSTLDCLPRLVLGLNFCYPLHSDAAGRVMVAPRRGTAQGTTRATTTKSASTTTTTATTDAAARTRGEPRVAVVTSDDEQCLLGAANGGLGSLRCVCSTPTLHICHPTAPFAEPAISSHGCDGGGDLPISVRPALAAIVTRRVPPYECKYPTTVWKLPPCALHRKSNSSSSISPMLQHPLALAIEQTGVPGISSGQASASKSPPPCSPWPPWLRRCVGCLMRHAFQRPFFAADGRILTRLALPASSPVTNPSAGPPHSSNALSVLSISGRGTI